MVWHQLPPPIVARQYTTIAEQHKVFAAQRFAAIISRRLVLQHSLGVEPAPERDDVDALDGFARYVLALERPHNQEQQATVVSRSSAREKGSFRSANVREREGVARHPFHLNLDGIWDHLTMMQDGHGAYEVYVRAARERAPGRGDALNLTFAYRGSEHASEDIPGSVFCHSPYVLRWPSGLL